MGRVYQNSDLDVRNEGVRRQLEFEGYDEAISGVSLEEAWEFEFDKMVHYAEAPDEKYSIGYIRMGAPKRFSKSNDATKRLFEAGEQREQEHAIQHYARENGYVKFHSVVDEQVSTGSQEESFLWLKMMLRLCEKKDATLLYCELGSIYRHPEFFALVRNARKRGVKISAIRDIRALETARRHAQKPKKRQKKGTRKLRLDQEEMAVKQRHPILQWKENQSVPTKRFNTYEHLYKGADPIYKFFIKPNRKDPRLEDPSLWQPVIANDRDIADDLNQDGYLTVGGYAWSKETVRKVRHLIFTDEFKSYSREKKHIIEYWERENEYSNDQLKKLSN